MFTYFFIALVGLVYTHKGYEQGWDDGSTGTYQPPLIKVKQRSVP